MNVPKITFPYIKGTTNQIAKILNKRNIRITFSPPNTIRGFIDSYKDRLNPRQSKGVYEISFSYGMV